MRHDAIPPAWSMGLVSRWLARGATVAAAMPRKSHPALDVREACVHEALSLREVARRAFAEHLDARPRKADPFANLHAMGQGYLDDAPRHPLQCRLIFAPPARRPGAPRHDDARPARGRGSPSAGSWRCGRWRGGPCCRRALDARLCSEAGRLRRLGVGAAATGHRAMRQVTGASAGPGTPPGTRKPALRRVSQDQDGS